MFNNYIYFIGDIGSLSEFSKLRTAARMISRDINVSKKLRRLFGNKPVTVGFKNLKVKGYLRNGRLVKAHARKVDNVLQHATPASSGNASMLADMERKFPEIKEVIDSTKNSKLTNSADVDRFLDQVVANYDSTKDKHAFALVQYSKFKQIEDLNLSPVDVSSLEGYIGNDYGHINEILQGRAAFPSFDLESKQYFKDKAEQLIKTIDKLPSRNNAESYRYLKGRVDSTKTARIIDFYTNNIGKKIVEPRAMSTTTDDLFNPNWINKSPVRIIVESKSASSNAKDIRLLNPKEMEVLYKPKSSFIIKDVKQVQRELNGQTNPFKSNKESGLPWEGTEIRLKEV